MAPKLAKATTAFYTGIRGKQTITYALKAGWTADVYYGFWQNYNYTKISIKSGAITDLTDVRERGNNYIFAILKQESTGLRIEDLIILSDVGGTVTPIPDLPAPAPQPDPTPAPQTNPTPAPQTNPTPVPQTNPTPVPQTNPTPAPQTNPTPAPQTNPTPAPSVSPTPKPTETPAAEVTATITPSALRVRYKKKASIKITSDSDAKITVTGKNAFAKNKKYVKIKSGKTAKLVFSKRAAKGKYVFKVTCSAKGKYKKTVKNITIRVK